ncbi:hypothetical protein NKG94_48710 [Micromonospora sp. M12]
MSGGGMAGWSMLRSMRNRDEVSTHRLKHGWPDASWPSPSPTGATSSCSSPRWCWPPSSAWPHRCSPVT